MKKQNKSLLKTPAHRGSCHLTVSGSFLPTCPCSVWGYHFGNSKVYSQVATSFSTTATTHLATVLINHLIFEQLYWSEPLPSTDRRHKDCCLPLITLSCQNKVWELLEAVMPWQWPPKHSRFSFCQQNPLCGRQQAKDFSWRLYFLLKLL